MNVVLILYQNYQDTVLNRSRHLYLPVVLACSLIKIVNTASLNESPILAINANEFLEYLIDFLECQCCQNQNIYVMGDFNIDLLKYETCSYTQTLLQTMQSFSIFPVVDKPTRVYGNSATLIDNIFINNPENNIVSGNIVSDKTDHFSEMCILTSHCKPFFPNNKTKVRDYSTFNAKSFIDDLQNINWNNICKHTDQSFSRFYKCVNKTINKH